jgi:hypothetical protein
METFSPTDLAPKRSKSKGTHQMQSTASSRVSNESGGFHRNKSATQHILSSAHSEKRELEEQSLQASFKSQQKVKQLPPLPVIMRTQPTEAADVQDSEQGPLAVTGEDQPNFIERNNQRLKEMQDMRVREKQQVEEEL